MSYDLKPGLTSYLLKSDDIKRRAIWEKNKNLIEDNNRKFYMGISEFTMAMNKYGDLVSHSFIGLLCYSDFIFNGTNCKDIDFLVTLL